MIVEQHDLAVSATLSISKTFFHNNRIHVFQIYKKMKSLKIK